MTARAKPKGSTSATSAVSAKPTNHTKAAKPAKVPPRKAVGRYTVQISFTCQKDISDALSKLESLVINKCADGVVDAVLLCKASEVELVGTGLMLQCKTTAQAAKEVDAQVRALQTLAEKQAGQLAELKAEVKRLNKQVAKAGGVGVVEAVQVDLFGCVGAEGVPSGRVRKKNAK